MCICMSCVHIFVYLCVYIHKQVPVRVFVHIHVCANLNVWPVCKCVFSHVFLCAYAFLCAYICAVLPTYVLLCICEYMWVCTLSLYFQTYLHLSLFLKIAHNLIRQQDKPLVFDSIVSECIIHSAYKYLWNIYYVPGPEDKAAQTKEKKGKKTSCPHLPSGNYLYLRLLEEIISSEQN